MALSQDIDVSSLDQKPFGLSHSLAGHPSLTMDSLARLIVEMPEKNVMFSKGLSEVTQNFEKILTDGKKGLDLREIVENIRTGNSYIAISKPELHPSFEGIFGEIVGDIGGYLKANGTGTVPLEPEMWLFIASPGAVTPFHFDRFSNIIMQIRGSKELAVFPPRVDAIISSRDTDAYLDRAPSFPELTDAKDRQAVKFKFKPGEAVHIPFVSGHYVKNGLDDISITISFFYHSQQTKKWAKAMRFNHILRRIGLTPRPIGSAPVMDSLKAFLHPFGKTLFDIALSLRAKLKNR